MGKLRAAYRSCAIIVLNTVVLFLMLEIATRLLLSPALWILRAVTGGPASVARFQALQEVIRREPWGPRYLADAAAYGYALQASPYVGFTNKPYRSATINIGDDGFRVVPGGGAAPHGPEVLVLGGSTVLGVGVPDWGTIPAYLARGLALRAGGGAGRVVNGGVGYWVSSQEVVFLTQRLRSGRVPEVVIFYDGVNDTARAAEHGRAGVPVTPPSPWPAPSRFLSATFRALRESGIAIPPTPFVDPPTAPVYPALGAYPRLPEARRQELAAQTFGVYAENVRFVERLARAYNVRAYFFWQPTLFTSRKPLSPRERAILALQPEAYADLMRRVDALVRQDRARPAAVIHLGDALDGLTGTVFMDWAHLLPAGNERIAQAILRHLAR